MSAGNGAVTYTWFANIEGRDATQLTVPWPGFVDRLSELESQPVKDAAPLIKFATFGDRRSAKGSIRHDGNVLHVTGIEGDYDGEVVTPEMAVALLEQFHVRAVVVTTWSHSPERPRWRVFAPLSHPVGPEERKRLCAALNGMLGGVLNGESFALSQSYFVGPHPDREYKVLVPFDDPEEGRYLDDRDPVELDEVAIYPPTRNGTRPAQVEPTGSTKIPERLRQELTGPGKVGRVWSQGADAGNDRSRNDAALAATLGARGFADPDIEAALRSFPLGQIGQGALGGAGADRQVGRLLGIASEARSGRDDVQGVQKEDFYAYMVQHQYLFVPSRELWPSSSVNARIPPIQVCDADGNPVLDDKGKPKTIPAATWLDQNRPVEQMTWYPGEPMVIEGRLIAHGGWLDRPGCRTFNLYRPPVIELGDPAEAGPWIDHTHLVYPAEADHIIRWLAHRRQRPHEKVNHALVLAGAQGTGKDSIIQGAVPAVGPWNVAEVSPDQLLGRFNGFIKSVIIRVSEARDLGDTDRFRLYDHLKTYTAAPPDVLRCDEKHLREYAVPNVSGVVITSNYIDGIFLPADDRRHFVAWTDLTKDDFVEAYWSKLYGWYEAGGYEHVAAYLDALDLSDFNPKAPPPKTAAFWQTVDAGRAPEDAELADALDRLGNPDAATLSTIADRADPSFGEWLRDRRNSRQIPHRMESVDYVPVRNDAAKDGKWKLGGRRQVVYVRRQLTVRDRLEAAQLLVKVDR